MKRVVPALLLCMGLAACESAKPAVAYRDQRNITTRPAPANGRAADLIVRVQQFQGPASTGIPETVPPEAKMISSIETLASFGTPFYCTVAEAEQRFELGGLVSPPHASDQGVRVELGFSHHTRLGQVMVTPNLMLLLGQTRVVMGCSDGRLITLTLEPMRK